MTGAHALALTGAVAAGVLLPKAVPAALLGRSLGGRFDRLLRLLPAATMAALVVVSLMRGPAGPRPVVVVAASAAALMMVLTRRSLLSMAVGWAVLVSGLIVK